MRNPGQLPFLTMSPNARHSIPGIPWRSLLSLFQLDVELHLFSISLYGNRHDVANFAAAKGIGEIVKILDGLVTKSNQNVSGLQPGFCRWRPGLHIRKFYAIFGLTKIGDRAEIRPVAATAGRTGMRVVLHDGDECRFFRIGSQLYGHPGDYVQQSSCGILVNFVPSIGRFVIVRLQARKEEEYRDAVGEEGGVIA